MSAWQIPQLWQLSSASPGDAWLRLTAARMSLLGVRYVASRRHSDRRCASPALTMGRRRGRMHAARRLRAFLIAEALRFGDEFFIASPASHPTIRSASVCWGQGPEFVSKVAKDRSFRMPIGDGTCSRPDQIADLRASAPSRAARGCGRVMFLRFDPQPTNGTAHAGTPAGLGGHGVRTGMRALRGERGSVPPLAAICLEGAARTCRWLLTAMMPDAIFRRAILGVGARREGELFPAGSGARKTNFKTRCA